MNQIGMNGQLPAVVSMSLGGGASTTTDNAVQSLIDLGFTVSVAAGNENQDACNVSPARVSNVSGPRPVLLWLHGGWVGLDNSGDGVGRQREY